ncbi:MAG: WbqC family protein [bacterium]|nr:WbqC family protein [bacterium]
MNCLLSSAYWPNLHYFYYIINSEKVVIEQMDHYQKQSFRNRTQILSANGVLDLSVPVINRAPKILVKDVEISYQMPWQQNHWRALTSAYKNSPYFDFFEDDINTFYTQLFPSLLEYNRQQLLVILKLLKLKKEIQFSTNYETKIVEGSDARDLIHPKLDFRLDARVNAQLQNGYYQTFGSKFPFMPNLSILDLLFNTGLETVNYLKSPSAMRP